PARLRPGTNLGFRSRNCGLSSPPPMDVTSPRSPTISRAIAAYVLSDVTTLTLSARVAGTRGGPAAPCTTASAARRASIAVGLMFMRSDRPNRLKGELVRGGGARQLAPRVLGP